MSKSAFAYVAVAACAVVIIIGVFSWAWQAAERIDSAPNRVGLAPQLMSIKSKSMLKLRDGLTATEYLLLEEGIAQLRGVNAAAGSICPTSATVKRETLSERYWNDSTAM